MSDSTSMSVDIDQESETTQLYNVIQQTEDYLEHAKTTLAKNRQILQESSSEDLSKNIESFKKETSLIFGKINKRGDILFKAIEKINPYETQHELV